MPSNITPGMKPCPFCGGEPRLIKRGGAFGYKCTCDGLRFVHTYGMSQEDAAEAWNTRALSAAPSEQPVDTRREAFDAGWDMHALLSPPAPAASEPVAVPILKGVGKINGDGWKDTTIKGETVFVWNEELPRPYAPGQFIRVSNEIHSASTAQYDFQPATLDEVKSLFSAPPAPTGWRTMESAPREELLLLCCANWAHSTHLGKPIPIKIGGYWDGRWHIFGASWAPTHWRPLPAAPTPEGAA